MNYVVIGGSSGIGLALVKKLADSGNQVWCASRQKGEIPESVNFIELDVTAGENQLKSQIPDVIDGLAFCPGTINLKPFARLTEADFLADFKINVLGAVKCIQTCLPALKKSETASIVMFSTVAVQTGMNFHSSIAASKGAIEGLTKSLAAEFASSKIRVNTLAPSLTDTPLAHHLISTPEKKETSDKRHPLGRIGTSTELADATFFLLSPNSSWITGQIIGIDGGMSSVRTL